MASLLEITNVARAVPIGGQQVPVYGISAEALAQLLVVFPEIGKAFAGMNVDRDMMVKLAPAALAAVIAAGTGHAGEVEHEAAARKLGVGDQLDLIDEIMRLTFPRGIGPFVKKLEGLGLLAGVEAVQEASPPPSPSPPVPKNSSPPVTKTP